MIFSEKLHLIRKNRGITQEELAEKINVSRQAVAKWENGQSYPDIEKLILVSDFFGIPIDRLVKDDEGCTTDLSEKPLCDEQELKNFLVKAKKNTYAGKGGESAPSRPSSHDFQYTENDLRYIDTYLGGTFFSGEEAVWKSDDPVYAMNYSGRVTGHEFSGDFLKKALCAVPETSPFRGPPYFAEGDYVYHCSTAGTFDWFQGYEEIYCGSTKVYECYFHGGAVK